MKKLKLIDEVDWMLTEEAKNDTRLNPIDKNILAILQWIANEKAPRYNKDGWFIIPLGKSDKIKSTSLEKYMEDFDVPTSYRTIQRVVKKLQFMGYINYKQGFWNDKTKTGCLPEIKILKGTIPCYSEVSDCNTEDCSVIVSRTEGEIDKIDDKKLSTYESENCGIIVSRTDTYSNTESDTNSNLKTNKETEVEKFKTFVVNSYNDCSWPGFLRIHPGVENKFNLTLEEMEGYYSTIAG